MQAPKIKPNSQPNLVIVYTRVSTDSQERSGLGIEAQLEACREIANRMNLTILKEYQETVSGKIDPRERPLFMDALKLAQANGARILIAKLDRFSREVYHVSGYTQGYMWGKETPDLLVADSPTMSQLEIYVKAMISEEERRAIGKRTKDALAVKKSQGWVNGVAGRQAKLDKVREATQDAINRAIELRQLGHGWLKIANTLNEEGFTTSKGGKWYGQSVKNRILSLGN